MKNAITTSVNVLCAASLLTLLPGCKVMDSVKGLFGGNKEAVAPMPTSSATTSSDKGPWMVRIDGKTVMNKADFDDTIQAIASSQQFRGLSADALPLQMKVKLLQNLAKLKLFERQAEEVGIPQTAEFKEQFDKALESIRQQLLVGFLQKQMMEQQAVSPEEVRAEYEKNRMRYVSQPGGVMLSGVQFASEDQARAFLASVQGHEQEFEELGRKAENGKYRMFGRVQEDSPMVPEAFKKDVLTSATFPLLKMVKDGNEYWVVYAADKKEPEYMNFEDIREHLENMLKHTKFQAELEKLESQLMKKYNLQINEDLLMQEAPAEAAEQAMGQMGNMAVAG